jgi:hypothetical protein
MSEEPQLHPASEHPSIEDLVTLGRTWQHLMRLVREDAGVGELWGRLVEGKRGIGGTVILWYGEDTFHEWSERIDMPPNQRSTTP